jgi:pimeloyl-ACP methyl ester carboxylesterase
MTWGEKRRPAGVPAHVVCGAGPPLVALHGGLSTSLDTFRLLGPELARDHLLIAPDLAGHGEPSTTEHTREDLRELDHTTMAEGVEAVLRHLEVDGPFHLLGFSLGAAVAMVLALRQPDRIASLTLLAANTVPTPRTRAGAASVRPEAIMADRPRLAAALERLHGPTWPLLAARLSTLWHEAPLIAPTQLDAFDPLLLIVGDRDPWIELAQQQAILDVCPAARLLVIPGADHFLLNSESIAHDVLSAFRRTVRASSGSPAVP